MLYLDCQRDPVRLTEHFRGTRESEQTKSWYQFCCNHIRQGFGVKMSHLWVPTNGHLRGHGRDGDPLLASRQQFSFPCAVYKLRPCLS